MVMLKSGKRILTKHDFNALCYKKHRAKFSLETLGQLIYNKKEIRIKKANSCQNYYRKECE